MLFQFRRGFMEAVPSLRNSERTRHGCARAGGSRAAGASRSRRTSATSGSLAPNVTPRRNLPHANTDLSSQNTKFDEARSNLSPNFAASPFNVNRAAIDALPQGTEAPIDKVLLQAPGSRRTPPPAAKSMFAMSTPTSSIASMASFSPTGSQDLAAFWIRALSAASR